VKRLQELIRSKKIIVIGVTGGVGCGKSTVLEHLKEKYNASIYKADEIGHKVMEPQTAAYKAITDYFGDDILLKDKSIDRKRLGAIVFNDEVKLSFMNSIIHPAVEEYIINGIMDEYNSKRQSLFVIEAALLIEAGYKRVCTELWYVYADEAVRIERLMQSRGYTLDKCKSIINNQLSDDIFRKECDFVLDNGNDFNNTKFSIEKHMKFCYNILID